MNKVLYLADRNNSRDNCNFSKTEVIIKAEDTGEVLFKGRNKVVLHGGMYTAKNHFGSSLTLETQKIETILGNMFKYDKIIDGENTIPEGGSEDSDGEIVRLFAVANDGCGVSGIDIKTVKYKDYIKYTNNPKTIEGLIPFALAADDESLNLDHKYYGKKTINNQKHYLFKEIEGFSANLISADGTIYSTENLNSIPDSIDLEFYVSVFLKISKQECRSLYEQVSDTNKRINSISLLTARKKVVNNIPYYYDIRPLTKLNFSNEYLIDPNKGIDITYNIYY